MWFPYLKVYLEKYKSKQRKIRYIQKVLEARRTRWQKIRASYLNQAAKMRQLPWIHSRAMEGLPDLLRMASSKEFPTAVVYKYCIWGQIFRRESSRQGFLFFTVNLCKFSSLFFCIFFRSCIRTEFDLREKERAWCNREWQSMKAFYFPCLVFFSNL